MTREIELTKGKVALVDDEDAGWLSGYSWCVCNGYAYTSVRSAATFDGKPVKSKHSALLMHREILKRYGLLQDGLMVDHINHDPVDNQKANLRACTRRENARNSSPLPGQTFKCGSLRSVGGRYNVTLKSCGKARSFGWYSSLIIAAQIYNYAAAFYYGEFANPNPIPAESVLSAAELLALLPKCAKHIRPILKAAADRERFAASSDNTEKKAA